MKRVRSFFGGLPKYLLWLLLSSMFWMWIFTFVKDAPAAKKIVLYASVPEVDEKALSLRLEEQMPDGIRMIRARSFDYVVFNDGIINDGDLYIIPASAAEDYLASYVPIERDGDYEYYLHEGRAYGIKIYDAKTGRGAATDYIRYSVPGGEAEDYYLFFGKNSLHTGEKDRAAFAVAETLLGLQDAPEDALSPAPSNEACQTVFAPFESDLYVQKVEGLPEDFILGMDVSSVLAEEASGVVYRGFDGQPQDLFVTLAEAGITHIRVRVWNDPCDENGNSYGGGNCDVNTAAEIGRRAANCGMRLIVDFHYSDFWADPSKQMAPKAWAGLSVGEKADALYDFTRESLLAIAGAGADVAMVQLGNETNGMLCGETDWQAITQLMKAGARAVREVCPDAQIAVHFTEPENADAYRSYARVLDQAGLDYDVFASSYYPFWHGSLENLSEILGWVAETYGKQVMVMETSYCYTGADSDFSANTISDGSAVANDWPYTVQGQANAIRDVIDTVAHVPNGIGVCCWEGAWISVGTTSRTENEALWERFGSGWASSYAAAYDPNDAGKYYGGCAVDNQAFFDPQGRPLESLRLFRLLREGSAPAVTADVIEDSCLNFDLAAKIVLPQTVTAVMTDGSRQTLPGRARFSEALVNVVQDALPIL